MSRKALRSQIEERKIVNEFEAWIQFFGEGTNEDYNIVWFISKKFN